MNNLQIISEQTGKGFIALNQPVEHGTKIRVNGVIYTLFPRKSPIKGWFVCKTSPSTFQATEKMIGQNLLVL